MTNGMINGFALDGEYVRGSGLKMLDSIRAKDNILNEGQMSCRLLGD
jgi:hypothetical protein